MSTLTKIQSFGGNVGIGVNDPGTNKLKVSGGTSDFAGLRATSLTVGSITHAHVPIGAIMIWSGAVASIPPGWKLCNGTTYTKTDGSGNIVSPDLRDRFIIGALNTTTQGTYAAGTTGGNHNVTLGVNNLPSHNHNSGATNQAGGHQHQMTTVALPLHAHNSTTGGAHNTHQAGQPPTSVHNHQLDGGAHSHPLTHDGYHSHELDIVDARYGYGNLDYSGTAGSWTAMANVTSYYVPTSPATQPRVEDTGNHTHNQCNYAGDHNHGALGTSPTATHTHSADSGAHNHQFGTNSHSHNLPTAGGHGHQVTVQSTGSSQAFSMQPPYYVLAYVMKI